LQIRAAVHRTIAKRSGAERVARAFADAGVPRVAAGAVE
jgi:hypothetical protein